MQTKSLEAIINERFHAYQKERSHAAGPIKRARLLCDRLLYKDEPEFLESADVSPETAFALVEELNRIEDRFGHTRHFCRLLETLISSLPRQPDSQPLKILDLGSGGGGLCRAIYDWAARRDIAVELYGVDISEEFVRMSRSRLDAEKIPVTFFRGDAAALKAVEDERFDVVVSSHLVHHLRTPGKAASFFREVCRLSRAGWLIVDLKRCFFGMTIMWYAFLCGGASRVITSDGIKSVRRAYAVDEINFILREVEKTQDLHGMICRPYGFHPYWVVMGQKTITENFRAAQ